MFQYLKSGATILLTPDPDWDWQGWDGRLTVFSSKKSLQLSADNIIIESDVPQFTLTAPRSYAAKGFSDVPGMISTALFTVDQQTLSDKIKVHSLAPLLIKSTGQFTASFAVPSQKITPGGPVPDPIAVKRGTWKVVEPNQKVFYKRNRADQPCIESEVPGMSHTDKLKAAIHRSEVSDAVLAEIGNVETIVTSMAVTGGILLALAATGIGALVEAVGAGLLVIGAAMSGKQIGEGINDLTDFYSKSKEATNCEDIGNAGKSFSGAVAKMGVGGITAALSFAGVRGAPKTGRIVPRSKRLAMFKANLMKAPSPKNPKEAIQLINNTLNEIEAGHAGSTDRMYGILDDKYVTYNSNGSVTALTRGHRIEIQPNGNFSIIDRKTGDIFLTK